MIAFVGSQRGADALAAVGGDDVDFFVVEDLVVFVERARLLGDRPEVLHERRERRAVRGVGVRGADDVGARLVHRPVDVVRGLVDPALALDNGAVGADEHEVVDGDRVERCAVAGEPEVVEALWVASGDVAVAEAAPTLGSEDPIGQREAGSCDGHGVRRDRR